MPLDPSIILGGKQPEIQNPLDTMSKVMAYKNLANRSQIEGVQAQQTQRDYDDQTARRNATAKYSTVDQSGNVSVDRAGMLKNLAQTAPHLVPQAAQSFAATDLAMQKQKLETLHSKLDAMGTLLGSVTDQKSYDNFFSQAKALGADTSQFPPQYDPGIVKHAQFATMSAKENIAAQMEQQKVDLQGQDLAMKREQFQQGKQQEAFKDLMGHAESSRQLPDVKQAYTDRYNTQKILDLIGGGDPNKLNPNMVQLLSSEVGKVATGAAPTEETLKNLTPQDAQMILARTKQYLSSNPKSSEQGAFVNVFKDYAKTIQDGASKVIDSNMGKLGSSYQPHVSSGDYKNFVDNYIKGNPYASKSGDGNSKSKSDSNSKDDYPVGTTAKSKSGVPVVYKGGGVWAPQ